MKRSSAGMHNMSLITLCALNTISRLMSAHVSMMAFSFSVVCCVAKRGGRC